MTNFWGGINFGRRGGEEGGGDQFWGEGGEGSDRMVENTLRCSPVHSILCPDVQYWKVFTQSLVGLRHCRLFAYLTVNPPDFCVNMRRGVCTPLIKEKEASKGTC